MRKIDPIVRREITARDDQWVQKARELASSLWKSLKEKERKDGKVRQLRNVQSIAEESESWAALSLFIRYQAARGELPRQWAEETVKRLEELREVARSLAASRKADPKAVHMGIVSRVLGYAVRWHVWDVEEKKRDVEKEEAK